MVSGLWRFLTFFNIFIFGTKVTFLAVYLPLSLLGKQVRTHQLTPLVAGSRENLIPAACSGISLPSRHSTVIPCWQSMPCRRCLRSLSPPLGQHSVAGRSINLAHDTRRPHLSRAWNDIPPTIRVSQSLLMFHQQLKTFLFHTTNH